MMLISKKRYIEFGRAIRKWRVENDVSMENLSENIFKKSGKKLSVYTVQRLERYGWASDVTIDLFKKHFEQVRFIK